MQPVFVRRIFGSGQVAKQETNEFFLICQFAIRLKTRFQLGFWIGRNNLEKGFSSGNFFTLKSKETMPMKV